MSAYLPMGTVVWIRGVDRKVMIVDRGVRDEENPRKIWDYYGLLYPSGQKEKRDGYFFDHSMIEAVCFMGFKDTEELYFREEKLSSGLNGKAV